LEQAETDATAINSAIEIRMDVKNEEHIAYPVVEHKRQYKMN